VGGIKREPTPPGPITDLFDRLHEIHIAAGQPSMREIATGIGRGVISSSTIHNMFRGPRVPKWGFLELVVEELRGDPAEFRALWQAARLAEDAGAEVVQGEVVAPPVPSRRLWSNEIPRRNSHFTGPVDKTLETMKHQPTPAGPITDLFDRLRAIRLAAGQPSARKIAAGIGPGVISSSTIHNMFRGPRVPKWGFLELVVEELRGDPAEFRALWQAARLAQDAGAEVVQGEVVAPPVPSRRLWSNEIPRRNPHFTGRVAELDALRANLVREDQQHPPAQLISGMGGVGKTEIATEYIHRHRDKYEIIWWIRAEHTDYVRDALVTLGQRLDISPADQEGGRDRTIAAVLDALARGVQANWLLVYDDAVQPLELQRYLPACPPNGHIVITSRLQNWPGYIETDNVWVTPFTEDEAVSFLRLRVAILGMDQGLSTSEDERRTSEAGRLAEALGHLPIAVEHAAAYLTETGHSVDGYLSRFEENAHRLLNEQPGEFPASVAATWTMSTELLTPDAEHLINLCAFFSSEQVPADLFFQGTVIVDNLAGLHEFLSSTSRFRTATSELNRLSLIKVDGAQDLIQMHRTVQVIAKEQLRRNRPDIFRAYQAAADALQGKSRPGNFGRGSDDGIHDTPRQHLKSEYGPKPGIFEARRNADTHETRAMRLIVNGQLNEAKRALRAVIENDHEREARLNEEFGFALTSYLETDAAQWVSGLWSILAAKSPMNLDPSVPTYRVILPSLNEGGISESSASPLVEESNTSRVDRNVQPAILTRPTRTPQVSGDILERSFLAILTRLFLIDDENASLILRRLRRQQPGTQYGHDVQFDCVRVDRETVRCHVECKNKTDLLRPADIADKILQTSMYWQRKKIDHLIFIAPHARISNELDLMIQYWHEAREYPFEIQVWAIESKISELFAAEPHAHEAIYGFPPPNSPSEKTLQQWRDRLSPTIRIPSTVLSYLTNPAQHTLAGVEDAGDFAELYGTHVRIFAVNALGAPVGDLQKTVRSWLDDKAPRALLLLGEFGDGKSFFGYTLTRQLATEYLDSPESGWLAVRLPLAELRAAGDGRELLQRRLRDIGIPYSDWLSATRHARTVIILDGLDEMSVKVDPSTVASNLRLLSSCVQNLPTKKIIITSRTNLFEESRQRDRFLEKLQMPMVFRLAPISRATRIEHLNTFAKDADLREKLFKLRRLYDPIGLAAKPLFLQMIKETLSDLPDDRFDQLILYDTYVNKSIRRKIEFLEDDELLASHEEIVEGLMRILEQVALKLHIEGCEFVDLKVFSPDTRLGGLSGLLWRITGNPADIEDEDDVRARVKIRSLLKQAEEADPGTWPVSFFHRSIREYFVARAIMRAIRDDHDQGRMVLRDAVLRPEIISFLLAMITRADDLPEIRIRLQSYARSAVRGSEAGHLGGNSLTLLFRLPGRIESRGWNGLELDDANLSGADLSEMDFSGSSLRQVIMNNANLTNTDLRGCDLTGVRLEETAPVVTLETGRSEAVFMAGYGDGSIREWSIINLDQIPRSLINSFAGLQTIGRGADNLLVILADMRITVLKEIEGSWQRITQFQIRADIRNIKIAGDRVALLKEDIARRTSGALIIFNCASRTSLLHAPVPSIGPFAVYGDSAIALPTTSDAVTVGLITGNNGISFVPLPIEHASAVSLQASANEELLIAVGTLTGRVCVMRISQMGSANDLAIDWDEQVHEGAVTSVSFVTGELFVTGGLDRMVAVHSIEGAATRTIHRLQLTISCAGVQTEGVHGPAEKLMFDQLRASGRLK
jgi:hypothetical protein